MGETPHHQHGGCGYLKSLVSHLDLEAVALPRGPSDGEGDWARGGSGMRAAANVEPMAIATSLERLRYYQEAKGNHGLLRVQGTVTLSVTSGDSQVGERH